MFFKVSAFVKNYTYEESLLYKLIFIYRPKLNCSTRQVDENHG